jgi:hypothetical protein
MNRTTTEGQTIVLSAHLDVEELENRILLSVFRDGDGWEAGSDDPFTDVKEGCSYGPISVCYRW